MSEKEIRHDNIMLLSSDLFCSKAVASHYVGGETTLYKLIESGEIEVDKPSSKQNGKWRCNMAQVLAHACNAREKARYKRKKTSQTNKR